MSVIGVLFCGYEVDDTIHDVLKPWIAAKETQLLDHQFVLSFCHGQFKEYVAMDGEKSCVLPTWEAQYRDQIDHVLCPPPGTEAEVRNTALAPLLAAGCDYVMLVDCDEMYSLDQIRAIFQFVSVERWISWFAVSLKNYVFDSSTYLVEPFIPPRLFRVDTNGYRLHEMTYDNDFSLKGTIVEGNAFVEKTISYRALPSKVIPSSVAFVRHDSWLSNERSKRKVAYQMAHFNGICSYAWDDINDKLTFNPEYYRRTGQPLPSVAHDIAP